MVNRKVHIPSFLIGAVGFQREFGVVPEVYFDRWLQTPFKTMGMCIYYILYGIIWFCNALVELFWKTLKVRYNIKITMWK